MEAVLTKVQGITKRRGFSTRLGAMVASLLAIAAFAGWVAWPRPIERPAYSARAPILRSNDIFVYRPQSQLKGTILFFGNDVGFWQPHQQLAEFLSRQGYAVIGYDLRRLLKSVADSSVAQRDAIVGDTIASLMTASIDEFHARNLPLLLMGHSLGGEIAIWAAAHISQPRAAGVVAMAPGSRGHLAITPMDYLSSTLPTGPDSYGMDDLVRSVGRSMKIAIVRGASDGYGGGDPQIVAAGAGQVERFTIPFAGHSLKKILIARYVIQHAMNWVLSPKPSTRVASN